MKKILALLLIVLPTIVQSDEPIRVLKVTDGDTFVISAPFIPKPLKQKIPLRLTGVDTPNIKRFANCDKEAELGNKAKEFVETLYKNSKTQEIKFKGMDKYNRILGEVYFDGKSVSESLLEAGLAKPYTGGKKESWCH